MVVFRRLSTQITNEGGLWDESEKLFPLLGATPREHTRDWRFPSGACVSFRHLQHEKDRHGWQGAQIPLIGFDELTHFTESQFFYMLSRNRSTCGVRPYVRATTNPDGRSWVKRFLAPWIDRTFPEPAASGELRWFVRKDGEIHWVPGGTPDAKSVTFVRASVYDNRVLLEKNPEYLASLKALPSVERAQLLDGDWDAGTEDSAWQVLPTRWVEAAMQRWPSRKPEVAMTCLGVDVAHGGADRTVLAPRYGDYVGGLRKYPGSATPDGKTAAAFAFDLYEPGATVNVDAIGYGAACHERLAEMEYRPPAKPPAPPSIAVPGLKPAPPVRPHRVNARAVNVGEKSHFRDRSGKYKMANQRAEMYWRLREALDPEYGSTFALPPDRELLADLTAPTYEITPRGIQIEAKDAIKLRLSGRSPDAGDAVCLSMLGDEKYEFL